MAIIKGFQLKAVKNFRGHEGEPLQQANLYFGNKKVGFVSEDSNGGCANIHVDRAYQEQWEQASKSFFEDYPEENILSPQESLFYKLFELHGNESLYKKGVKKGYSISAVFCELRKYENDRTFPVGEQIILSAVNLKQVENYEEKNWKGKLYTKEVFTSLEDFILA